MIALSLSLPCALLSAYPFINFPHLVPVNAYIAFVLPTSHSSPPIFPFPLPSASFPASTHAAGLWLVLCLMEGGITLTSTAEQKQRSYLRGFVTLSELLIHHVSSLFCLEMLKEICRYLLWDSFMIPERQDSCYDSEFRGEVAYINKRNKVVYLRSAVLFILSLWGKKK